MPAKLPTTSPTVLLDRHIRAKYPIIVVSSPEEARVEKAVQQVVADLSQRGKASRALFTWTISLGLASANDNGVYNAPEPDETKDPIAALQAIVKWDAVGGATPTVFLFKDLHGFLQDPVIVRYLRDVVRVFQTKPYTLILLSPDFKVPGDLEKDVAVIDWPLPDLAELTQIVDLAIQRLPKQVKCQLVNGAKDRVVRALSGLTQFEADSVLSMAVVTNLALNEDAIPVILAEKKQIIRKSGYLEYYDADVRQDEIGGLGLLKEYTRRKRAAFSAAAEEYGLDAPRGLLAVGVPGSGKSLTAKASTGGQMPLLRLDVGSLMGSLVGQSEANARSALKVAEAVAPCVLWIDEIEKGMAGMSGGGENDGGTSRRVLGTILTWMQEHTAPVYIFATANDVRALPPELLRRFDDLFWVDLPGPAARAEILAIHLGKRRRDPAQFDLVAVAQATDGFTGAELEKVVSAALVTGFDEGRREIATADLLQAAREVVPVSRTMGEKINELRAWAKDRARPASAPEAGPQVGDGGRQIEL